MIGITAGHLLGEGNHARRQYVSVGCGQPFVECVVRAGCAAVLLPPVDDRRAVRAMVDAVDALLLSGGGDVAAVEFGAEPHPNIRAVDPPRDRMELEATRLAARRGMPILAICRGIQVLNIALGGDIIQDIAAEVEKPVQHWAAELAPGLCHSIDIDQSSLLASLIGGPRVTVSSYHHQAVGRVAKGLRIVARAADGVVEALEASDGRPILGVQFHPEENAWAYPQFQAVFDWFARRARRFGRPRRSR